MRVTDSLHIFYVRCWIYMVVLHGAPKKRNPLGQIRYLWNCINFFVQINSAYRGGFRHIFCKFHCNICLCSRILTIWTWMCILQSEQVIKLRFWLKITSLIFKSPYLNPLDYHVRCNIRMLYMPKPTNIATGVHWYGNPVISKETSILCCCSWRTLWTLGLNTERAADILYWSVWNVDEKVVQSLVRY